MDKKSLKMQESAYRKVVQDAASAWPSECCGALLGRSVDGQEMVCEAVLAAGAETTTGADFFRIGARDMVAFHARAVLNQWEILGFYHSHPGALAVPSNADLPREIGDVAMQNGATWPEHCLLIASTRNGSCGEIRAWRLTANANDIETSNIRYEPLEIEIIAAQTQECRDSAGK